MDRRDPAKPVHLCDREIAHAYCTDRSTLEQRQHRLDGFFDRHSRVGPVDLVDVDIIGSKPAQRIVDLAHDLFAARITKDFAISPFKSDLRRDKHTRAQAAFSDGFADDLFGMAKTIDWRRIDDINAMVQCGADGGNRFSFISSPHIQPQWPRCRSRCAKPSATCRGYQLIPCDSQEIPLDEPSLCSLLRCLGCVVPIMTKTTPPREKTAGSFGL